MSQSAPKSPPRLNLPTLAAVWCSDPRFQRWIGAADTETARARILATCGITSRGELAHDDAAARTFHAEIRKPFAAYLKQGGNGDTSP